MRIQLLVIFGALALLSSAEAQNQIVSAGYDIPAYQSNPVAAGQVITLFVRGINAPNATATTMPLPNTLSGITVRVKSDIPDYPDRLPILSVRAYDFCAGRLSVPCPLTHVTVQIPIPVPCTDCAPSSNPSIGPPSVIVLGVEQNGVVGQDFPVVLTSQQPRILNSCDTVFGIGGICGSFITHTDGSMVTCAKPAKQGETVVIYGVGLGPTNPSVKTGGAAPSSPAAVYSLGKYPLTVSYRINQPAGSPAPPVAWFPMAQWFYADYVGLVPEFVGLYQINFTVPTSFPLNLFSSDTQANVRIAIGAGATDISPADGVTHADFCVQPQ